jgi:hypothetical protein
MKIKLAYPKIPDTLNCPLKQCVAFEKYDGTNIHLDFQEACGCMSFGTRRDSFKLDIQGEPAFVQAHPELAEVPELIETLCYDDGLDNFILYYRDSNYKEIKVFAEFFGENSFAGSHHKDDKKQLVIFDVMVDGKIIPPEQMLEDFKKWNLAKVVFQGKFTGQLFVDVRKGKYPVKEGVVVKGVVGNEVYMAKIKTEAYMDKLKAQFKDNWKEYWE